MKKLVSYFLFVLFSIAALGQQKDFQGKIVYKVDVTSKSEGITADAWKKTILIGDSLTVYVKDGNYKRSCGPTDEYYIAKEQKAYVKIKGIDTLYYRPYNDDTTSVSSVEKTEELKDIAGYNCKTIILKTRTATRKFYYSPALYQNPDWDKNNTIGGFNVYSKETSSIWLQMQDDYTTSVLIDYKAMRVNSDQLDDHIFDLPQLPIKQFNTESIFTKATYRGGQKNWVRYLQENLNVKLALKYVKLKKGEASANQQALVSFIVLENGELSNIKVINSNDVHPKLAQEAIRVITESGTWKPAQVLNEKIIYHIVQPITFQVDRE